jgi:hypothetical protein
MEIPLANGRDSVRVRRSPGARALPEIVESGLRGFSEQMSAGSPSMPSARPADPGALRVRPTPRYRGPLPPWQGLRTDGSPKTPRSVACPARSAASHRVRALRSPRAKLDPSNSPGGRSPPVFVRKAACPLAGIPRSRNGSARQLCWTRGIRPRQATLPALPRRPRGWRVGHAVFLLGGRTGCVRETGREASAMAAAHREAPASIGWG